jgi:hypothetical protein
MLIEASNRRILHEHDACRPTDTSVYLHAIQRLSSGAERSESRIGRLATLLQLRVKLSKAEKIIHILGSIGFLNFRNTGVG